MKPPMPSHLKSHQPWIESLMTGAIAIACMVGISILQVPRLSEIKASREMPSSEVSQQQEQSRAAQLNLLRWVPTFGFDNLFSSWMFLQFIQYFGDGPARQHTGYGLSPDYFDVILSRDPYFRLGYFFLSASTSLYAGRPERTVEIIERELPNLSPTTPDRAYYIWRYKGIDELLFLGDAESAKRSFEMAAEWASVYSDPESEHTAQLSLQTAEFLANNSGSQLAQISAWSMVFNNAFDEPTRQLAVQRMQDLGADVSVDEAGNLRIQLPQDDATGSP
jgi:hypothetical protein